MQETRFWKTLGIFLRATRFPSLGSVTDLDEKGREEKKSSFGSAVKNSDSRTSNLMLSYESDSSKSGVMSHTAMHLLSPANAVPYIKRPTGKKSNSRQTPA